MTTPSQSGLQLPTRTEAEMRAENPTRASLIEVLLMGEAACRSMMLFDPISANQSRWRLAANATTMHIDALKANQSQSDGALRI